MPLITITPSNVQITDDTKIKHVFAGEAVAQGQIVYRSGGVDGQYFLTDSGDGDTCPESLDGALYGMALNEANAAGGPLAIAKSGTLVDVGNVLAAGKTYWNTVTIGSMADTEPSGGKFSLYIGQATAATQIALRFHTTGIATA